MANNLAVNPLRIDTAMGSPATKNMYIEKIYWFNPTLAGDTVVITDGSAAGNILWEGRAEAANSSQVFDLDSKIHWNQFRVTTLSSGVLYIYYGSQARG